MFPSIFHYLSLSPTEKEEGGKKKRKNIIKQVSHILPFILRPREKMSCPRSVLRPPRDAQIVKAIPTGMIEFRHGRHDDLDRGYRPFPYQIENVLIYNQGSLKLDSLYANVAKRK